MHVIIAILLFMLPCDGGNDAPTTATELFRRTGLYFMPVTVGDHAITELVDTGAAACILDRTFYDRHIRDSVVEVKQVNIITGAGNAVPAPVFEVEMGPAGLPLQATLSAAMNLGGLSKHLRHDLDAIVGFSFFKNRRVQFDGTTGTVLELADSTPRPASMPYPLRAREFRPVIPIHVAGLGTQEFLIDTGMTGAMALELQQLEKLYRAGSAIKWPPGRGKVISADGKPEPVDYYTLRRVTIGSVIYHNVTAVNGREAAVGMALLRHSRLTIDPDRQWLWMEPTRNAAKVTFPPGGTGFNFVFDSEGRLLLREELRSGGPAEVAGMQAGDEILEIDGKSPDQFSFWSLTDYFSRAGETVHLKCRRDGEDYEVDLTLRHPFQYPPEWPAETEDVETRLFHRLDFQLVPCQS